MATNDDATPGNMARGPYGVASQRYAQGFGAREPYLRRARDNAALTIPWLFRMKGSTGATDEEIPWQCFGAHAIGTMAAKVILVLFPIGTPPMKLKPGDQTLSYILQAEQQDPDQGGALRASIEEGLSAVEQEFSQVIDEDGDRAKLAIGALKIICGGNHGFQFYDDGLIRGISLDRYVTWRDARGELLEFVIEDPLAWETIPADVRAKCLELGYKPADEAGESNCPIFVYTHGRLEDGLWQIQQEVYGHPVEGSAYTRTPEALDYFFTLWQPPLDGEHYSRSYVEHYLGDFQTMEGITQSVTEAAAGMASWVRFVHPGGLTSKRAVAEAQNGDVLSGRAEDVTVPLNNKGGDLQVADGTAEKAQKRLSAAFLLNSSIQRQGERVTAEEIRFLAQELEDAQAGAYAQQVVTWQRPYCTIKLRYAMKAKRVTPLPLHTVKVTIIGGLGALGRNADLDKLDSFVGGAAQALGPQVFGQAINPRVYLRLRGAALGIKTTGLIYSEQEAQQMQQQDQLTQAAQTLGPEAIRQIGSNLTANQVADTNADAKIATSSPAPAPAQAAPAQGA